MALKFIKKKKRIPIDWKDGAIIFVQQPNYSDILAEFPSELGNEEQSNKKFAQMYGLLKLKASIVGWENIIGEEKQADGSIKELPIEYNHKNKDDIFDYILENSELVEKIKIAIKDETENLASGSTASMNTDGNQKIA